MKTPSIHPLSSGEVKVSTVADEVFTCQGRAGLMVCAVKQGMVGAFYLNSLHGPRLGRSLEELVKKMDGSFSVKLIGNEELRKQAKRLLSQHPSVTVAADVAAREFEVFIYVGTGRIRMREIENTTSDSHASSMKAPSNAPIFESAPTPARVLIVDDSKTIRSLLRQILSSDSSIEVVGEAERPSQVEEMIEKLKPTVITLDINMPEMDGVTLLSRYLPKYRIPTVMVTAISMQEGDQVLRALNLGAVDYIQKPSMAELRAMSPLIIEKIKVAASVTVKRAAAHPAVQRPAPTGRALDMSTIVAIGASTGGVQALESVLTSLPAEIPPIVIVQHIPPVFSAAFAKRLDDTCPFEVREAQDGDEVRPDRVLIAAGGTQMKVERSGSGLKVRVFDGAPVNRHKPSVDVLFDSVAEVIGKNAIGVILTGMGADGAKGLLKMKQSGARTIAQDKDSCVVYGMPRAAIELGAAEEIKPLHEVPEAILRLLSSHRKVA